MKKILGVLGAVALAVGIGVSPAQATKTNGEWWTNTSTCINAYGEIRTQLKYQNLTGNVRVVAVWTYTTFGAKVTSWRLRQYWELNGVKLNSSSRTWNFTGVSSNPSTATFYANPQFAMIAQGSPTAPTYGEYSVTLKVNSTGNYIACQGRAQIGM